MANSDRRLAIRYDCVVDFLDSCIEYKRPEKESHVNRITPEINGIFVSGLWGKRLKAWRRKKRNPSLWTVDEYLAHFWIPLQHFFDWCDLKDRNPWAYGEPPGWWDEDHVWEDFDSIESIAA